MIKTSVTKDDEAHRTEILESIDVAFNPDSEHEQQEKENKKQLKYAINKVKAYKNKMKSIIAHVKMKDDLIYKYYNEIE